MEQLPSLSMGNPPAVGPSLWSVLRAPLNRDACAGDPNVNAACREVS
jgi:hypothetical protein